MADLVATPAYQALPIRAVGSLEGRIHGDDLEIFVDDKKGMLLSVDE